MRNYPSLDGTGAVKYCRILQDRNNLLETKLLQGLQSKHPRSSQREERIPPTGNQKRCALKEKKNRQQLSKDGLPNPFNKAGRWLRRRALLLFLESLWRPLSQDYPTVIDRQILKLRRTGGSVCRERHRESKTFRS